MRSSIAGLHIQLIKVLKNVTINYNTFMLQNDTIVKKT